MPARPVLFDDSDRPSLERHSSATCHVEGALCVGPVLALVGRALGMLEAGLTGRRRRAGAAVPFRGHGGGFWGRDGRRAARRGPRGRRMPGARGRCPRVSSPYGRARRRSGRARPRRRVRLRPSLSAASSRGCGGPAVRCRSSCASVPERVVRAPTSRRTRCGTTACNGTVQGAVGLARRRRHAPSFFGDPGKSSRASRDEARFSRAHAHETEYTVFGRRRLADAGLSPCRRRARRT